MPGLVLDVAAACSKIARTDCGLAIGHCGDVLATWHLTSDIATKACRSPGAATHVRRT